MSFMFSCRKHHRRADWLYSAQLVACLVRIAVSVICASTENLAGHGFVSVNIRPCLYIHYLVLVYD